MVQNSLTGSPKQTLLNRTRYYLLASKMEDQFGNTVQYQYDSSGYPTRIWSDDGREIVLNYAGGRLSTVAAHGKIWSYQYSSEGNLTSVTLPDGSLWQYDYTGNLRPNAPVSPEGQSNNVWCQDEPYLPNWTYQIVITHPGGAHGLFKFLNRRHYRSGVHLSGCEQDWPVVFSGPSDQPTYTLLIPNFFDVMSLGSKTISGTGLSTMAWNYDYGVVPVGLWGTLGVQGTYPCTTCQQYKTVTVTNPDGTKTRQKYGIQYWFNDGRLLQMETVSASGVVVRTETNEYLADADAPVQAFYGEYGAIGSFADPGSVWIRPMVKRSIIQQGRTFNWEVAKACAVGSVTTYCFDTYARPTKVTTSSAPSP
jgi:YD repeat-containing protein